MNLTCQVDDLFSWEADEIPAESSSNHGSGKKIGSAPSSANSSDRSTVDRVIDEQIKAIEVLLVYTSI